MNRNKPTTRQVECHPTPGSSLLGGGHAAAHPPWFPCQVLSAIALAIINHTFQWLPATICFTFAVLAQIASNFANEYFDYRDGLDSKGRVGPRRGVAEGDITPRAMLNATLIITPCHGSLGRTGPRLLGGWRLVAAGVVIVCGALAYSAGPYPLSRHLSGVRWP